MTNSCDVKWKTIMGFSISSWCAGFSGHKSSGVKEKPGISSCLNLMMPFSPGMSLRKITESYLELTIDPYFMECLAAGVWLFAITRSWLRSRYANELEGD